MKKTHLVKIGKLTRKLPIIPVSEKVSIALFNSISDTEVIIEAAKELSKKIPRSVDLLITPEAKSIPLAFELSKQLSLPYVVARKSKKPYMGKALEQEVSSITTGKMQSLYLDEKDITFLKGKKVAIVDDVISTGATVIALKKLAKKARAEVVSLAAVFTEGDEDKWRKVISLGHLPIFG